MVYNFNDACEAEVLCEHCDMKRCSSNPVCGCVLCEGAHCDDAYQTYLENIYDNPCNHCKNAGLETMDKVAACNCCDKYSNFDPAEEV